MEESISKHKKDSDSVSVSPAGATPSHAAAVSNASPITPGVVNTIATADQYSKLLSQHTDAVVRRWLLDASVVVNVSLMLR